MKRITLIFVYIIFCNYFSYGQSVSCKTFLQGSYQGGSLMSVDLTIILPGTQPYNVAPWNYNGAESLNSIPSNMVDWVLVELRDPVNPTIIISRRAALLLDNGDVADTNLTTLINFPGISPGNYYLCILHRNHFPVMSANPESVPSIISYDFSDTLNFPPYGGGSKALIELESGLFGMIAGDVNKDGVIKYSGPDNDRGPVLQYIVISTGSTSITNTTTGYRDEDINMDNIIKYSGPGNDPSIIIQNLVGLTGSTSITSIYYSIVPQGIPAFQCGDTLTDVRDGQRYATVQIGFQCWMAENLNIGTRIDGSNNQINNDTTEKYCYNNIADNCNLYGGLYQWDEMMQYVTTSGVQGICPPDWHISTDEEWKVLEGTVDSQYSIGDPVWNITGGFRGYDAGLNLKSTVGWNSSGNGTDLYGFSAIPAGVRDINGNFSDMGNWAAFWCSMQISSNGGLVRGLYFNNNDVYRSGEYKEEGYSVRCIKDCLPQPGQSDAGPDSLNIAGDSIVLMGNYPVNGHGLWTIINGTGGYFADSTNPATVFYGVADNSYNLVWTISNNCGSSSDTVIIGFAAVDPQPCPGIATFIYGGQVYNTVQIGTQCWMAENLNIGTRINGEYEQANNGTIQKYCYNDIDDNCNIYGGLYQWDEMMQYDSTPGIQGICPPGWFIPADADWKILEGTVDSLYGVGDPEWDQDGERGYDAGLNLKYPSGWNSGGNGTDLYGFSGLSAGFRGVYGDFLAMNLYAYIWSSSEHISYNTWARKLLHNNSGVGRHYYSRESGFSVRCLLDCAPQPTQSDAGPDLLNISGDSIVLMGNVAVIGQGVWSVFSGTGGSFADSANPTTLFYGMTDSTYILAWTISNNCGYSSDTVIVSFGISGFVCGAPLSDPRDGQSYNTVHIGTQCWMAENLNIGTMISGNNNMIDNGAIEKYCYDNNPANCITYGGLYQWNEMMQYVTTQGTQGICPAGWHLGDDSEWQVLVDFLGSSGGKMKEAGTTHWNPPNTDATNESGFTALPAGQRLDYGGFYYKGDYTNFWSSTEVDIDTAWFRLLYYNWAGVSRLKGTSESGFSVRCLFDCTPQPTQSDAGPDVFNISGDSVVMMANVAVNGQGLWTIISGTGGSLNDPLNPTSIFYGVQGNTYHLLWTISNSCGSSSDTVLLGFGTSGFACGDPYLDTRDGQTYNTVQIGTQCWLAENLNVGIMINGNNYQLDNDTIEKYCYNNDPANCSTYGGLYQWDEMMQYVTTQGVQGICPAGWRIASDDEWKILEGTVDSQFGVGNPEWNQYGLRGFDAGLNLKTTSGWAYGGNGTDLYDFSILPAGYRDVDSYFYDFGEYTYFWTSTEDSGMYAWSRLLYCDENGSVRVEFEEEAGFSVRCLHE